MEEIRFESLTALYERLYPAFNTKCNELKSNNIDVIDKKMIESKCKKDKSNVKRNNKDKIEDKTTSKNEIDKLVGLDEIKELRESLIDIHSGIKFAGKDTIFGNML